MTLPIAHTQGSRSSLANPALWIAFILYIIIAGYAMTFHEPWGDEIHSWNIVKGSVNYFDLILNTRYEGHPPVWYTIMWPISKLTHNFAYVQLVHLIIASLTVFLVLFFSPFSFFTRILIPLGYYFLYEYALLSRNYAIGVLLAFCICIVLRKNFRYKLLAYYVLLFLLSNTHLLCLLLAGALHVYFLLLNREQKKSILSVLLQALLGALVLLPALYFIFPPSNSALNTSFWINKWNPTQLVLTAQAPWRAFVPIPAWWNYHSWNTNFLLEAHQRFPFLKFVSPLLSLFIVVLLCWVLKANRKSLALFATNLLLTFFISVLVFPVTWGRYVGFIYIGFLVAYWLYCYEARVDNRKNRVVYGIFIAQLIAGIFSVVKDIRSPFSNFVRVNELLKEVPVNERVVTDYWALNAIATFADRPFYCVDLQKEVTFLLWDKDQAIMQKKPHRYVDGLQHLFQKESLNKVYLVTLHSPEILFKQDSLLPATFHIKLVDRIEGAIEKGGNLYLYRVNSH